MDPVGMKGAVYWRICCENAVQKTMTPTMKFAVRRGAVVVRLEPH